MSNYNSLKATIDANIKQNGNQEITGEVLNSVLNQMVTTLGAGYQFAGVATLDPATDPGSPDAKVFYIANGKGTYTNFGGIEVTEDDVVVLYYDTEWHKVATGIASQEKLLELNGKTNQIEVEDANPQDVDEIEILDNNGNEVAKVNSNGLYVNENGYKKVATKEDISLKEDSSNKKTNLENPNDETYPTTKAVADAIEKYNDITSEDAKSSGEQIDFTSDDESEVYASVNKDGVKAKAYMDMNGVPINLNSEINISLPDKIYAVVGDTLQLFYRGMIQAVNPYNYNILISCSKGSQYPRYFEYTPSASDVGAYTFKVTIKNDNGVVLVEKSTSIVVRNAPTSVSTPRRIYCFGDSLTTAGTWCAEAFRRLVGTGGTPSGKGLSNIIFCGKKKVGDCGYFGEGGWQWNSYTTSGRPAFRFQVNGVTSLSLGATYTNNGYTYTIIEVNVTEGVGNILCSTSSASYAPTASGILTKASGSGDDLINYSSYSTDSQNPLWDYTNNKMTFVPYADAYGDGIIDVVYTLLSWNGQSAWKKDFTSVLADVKTFADTLHSEFPNAKLKIMGIQVPSIDGGMGANYGATGSGYADAYGMVVTALNMNSAFQEFANRDDYKDFVEFVNVSSQFDSENNMPSSSHAVNTRSAKTELRGTNGLHPSNDGYNQIADVVFRNLVAEIS